MLFGELKDGGKLNIDFKDNKLQLDCQVKQNEIA